MNQLHEYLKAHPPKGFKPVPHYSPEGDTLFLYFEDVLAVSESLPGSDHGVTVERANDDGRIVGVKIHNAAELLRRAGCVVVPPG